MTNVLFAQDYKEGSKVPTVSNPPFNVEDYQEQTEMKHKVLRDYLDKWVKILGVGFTGRLNYIDGFAGLGAYSKNGEIHYGSPVIAAEVIKNNRRFVNHSTLTLIDADNLVLENLQKVLNYKGFYNCEEMEVRFINKDFNKAINEDILKKVEGNLSPTFAFIDTFGFEGIHFETIIVNYYVSRLKKISKFVIPYRLDFPNKRRTYYYLIHLTNHYLGASIMKSSFGKFSPSGLQWLGNSAQTSLADILNIDSKLIKDLLVSKYNKQSVSFKQIMIDNIDTTPYNESQFREALKELETENVVYIERFPKIGESGRPLTAIDVKSDQIIHFNCFPSIERKSLLYETKVEYGNFTINHAFGCAHGCKYPCYAFLMARSYGKAKNY